MQTNTRFKTMKLKQTQENTLRLLDQLELFANQQDITEVLKKSYITWILRFIRFHGGQHPKDLKQAHVEAYLSYLARSLSYDFHAQQSACNALCFLYQQFLNMSFEALQFPRLRTRRGFFSRFGERHCFGVINYMSGTTQLMAKLAVYANLKLQQVINLRLGDVNLKNATIVVRDKKGNKLFTSNLPMQISLELRIQMMKVRALVQQEKERQFADKYSELDVLAKSLEPDWQYLFPYHFSKLVNKSASLLNKVPIKILKNDIQLAIKNYLRFMPNSNSKPVRFNTGVAKLVDNRVTTKQLSQDNWAPSNVQRSFNFDNKRGAA